MLAATRIVGGVCFFMFLLLPGSAGAQEEDLFEDEFELLEEEVVFTAAKHEQAITESPSAVTVITREQIENTHCTDLICLLRQVPEVHVRRLMPMYAVAGARAMAGESGDKALLIIDGREVNIEIFGSPIWMVLPVHLEDIERVEVIRGPGSALYGANAHSMVVSVFTQKTEEDFSRVFIGGGEHDRIGLHARAGVLLADWRLQVSGGYETGGNWRLLDKRESTLGRIRLRVDRETDESQASLQLGFVVPKGGIYTSLAPTESTNAYLGHLLAWHQTDWYQAKLSLGVYGSDFHMDMPLFYGPVKLGDFPETVGFFSSNLDGEAQFNWRPFDGNLLIAGGNYRWITMVATNNRPEVVHQHRVGVFLHDEQRLAERLVLTLGVRLDYNTITPFTVSPRLACVWRFAGGQFLRFAFGRAFRKPSFMNTSTHFTGVLGKPGFEGLEEFFVNSVGNEKLGNESITAFEIGYRSQFLEGELTIEADAFFNLYRDTIAFHVEIMTGDLGLPDLAASKMKYRNTGREVNCLGGSLSLAYRIKGALWAGANYTYRYTWYISAPEEVAVVVGGKGDRLPWEPAQLANLSLHYLQKDGFRCGLSVHGASEHDLAMPMNGGLFDDPIMVHSPPFVMVGGFVAWRVTHASGWFEAGVRAFNAFHQGFRDTQAVTRPDGAELGGELIGRQIFLYLRGRI
jgi:outer membrane receptor for ferrienterochelin and colicin